MQRFEKVFEATVNVANPINFCTDKARHLTIALQNKYVGRCFKGAYVLGVKKILECGACHIMRTNGTGEGYVDVRFLADVAVFSSCDILTGVEIVSNQPMLVGSYEGAAAWPPARAPPIPGRPRAAVIIRASEAAAALAVGQKIPVRILLARHAPMQAQASVVGSLLVCDQTAPAYRLRDALDLSARAELAPMLAAVELELEARAAMVEARKADLWFFERLLYAFREAGPAPRDGTAQDEAVPAWEGGPVWGGPRPLQALEAGAETASVLDIVRRVVGGERVPVAGVWSRSLALYRSSPLVAVVREGAAVPGAWTVVDGAPRAVFAEFLKNILDFLVATRELVLGYNSRKLIEDHTSLWRVMRSAQSIVGQ